MPSDVTLDGETVAVEGAIHADSLKAASVEAQQLRVNGALHAAASAGVQTRLVVGAGPGAVGAGKRIELTAGAITVYTGGTVSVPGPVGGGGGNFPVGGTAGPETLDVLRELRRLRKELDFLYQHLNLQKPI